MHPTLYLSYFSLTFIADPNRTALAVQYHLRVLFDLNNFDIIILDRVKLCKYYLISLLFLGSIFQRQLFPKVLSLYRFVRLIAVVEI